MKKVIKRVVLATMLVGTATGISAQNRSGSLGDLLGGIAKETIAQTQSKTLEVADIAGQWTVQGPAVVLKSDNILQQAGGAALTGMLEDQIKTYYERLGLIGNTMTIESDGSFVMTLKKIPLKGTITKGTGDEFNVKFGTIAALQKDGTTAYIQKSGNEMSFTVDVKKMLTILEKVGSVTDRELIMQAVQLLEKYDHVCLGFRCTK